MTIPTLSDVFLAALETRTTQDRQTLLDEVCQGRPEVRQRVERMLQAQPRLGDFLQRPALGGDPALGDSEFSFLTPPDQPGSLGRLEHYKIEKVIGCGGCGVVFKGRDEKLQRTVAIKTLAESLAASATARARFVREAQAAAAVNHDNVVRIYAVEEAGPVPYLVMEYVEGISLDEKLRREGPLPIGEVLRIGSEIASGLAAAHEKGLVHRDVKPGNILLEEGTLRVKITDFGLARAVDDATISREGLIAGTPEYMSPEQARGAGVDQRSDLFSLGSVLYAMWTGRSPFAAEGTLAVLKRICEDEPAAIAVQHPEVPDWLVALISKLHAKDSAHRVGSAREVAELLDVRLAQPPGPDAPTTLPAPTPQRSLWRWRLPVAATALAALALVGLLLPSAMRPIATPNREPSSAGQSNKKQIQIPAAPSFVGLLRSFSIDYQVVGLAISPTGRTVAVGTAARLGPAGPEWNNDCPIVLLDLESGTEIRRLAGHASAVRGLAFSPDGMRLVSASSDGSARVWDVGTGAQLSKISLSPSVVLGLNVSPGGGHVLASGDDQIVRLLQVQSGNVLWHSAEHTYNFGTAALSPDATLALIGSETAWDNERRAWVKGSDHALRLWDVRSGQELRRLAGHTGYVVCAAFSPDGRRVLSGAFDKTIRLWDVATGQQLFCFDVPGILGALAISPDGRRAISSGGDQVIRLWDLVSGRQLYACERQSTPARCLLLISDGHTALSGGADGIIHRWQLPK